MIRLLAKDIIYAGLTVGPCLTLLEILKKASDIKLFAFSSGSFFIIQILQFNKVINVNNENLEIEKSIFLGEKKIIDGTCITISGNLVNKNKIFNWEIKKNI